MHQLRTMFAALGLFIMPTIALAAPTTFLHLTGPAGEYISQGQNLMYTPSDGTFQIDHSADTHNGIRVWFRTPSYDHWWYVEIGGPDGTSPQVGTYTDAQRFEFAQPGHPRLAVFGDGRGCNEDHGSFTVKEVTYDSNGAVLTLWVIFTQYCDANANPLTGEFQFQIGGATPTRSTSWGALKSIYR